MGIAPPAPTLDSTFTGFVQFFQTGGAMLSTGCTSNGSTVACKSDASPRLTVYNGSGSVTLFTSQTSIPNGQDACGRSVADLFDNSVTAAAVGTTDDGTIIAADEYAIYRFNLDGSWKNASPGWGRCYPSAIRGVYKPQGLIITTDGSGNVNATILLQNGPVMTFDTLTGTNVTTVDGASPWGYFRPGLSEDQSYYFAGTNSACADHGRIYAVMNQTEVNTADQQTSDYQNGVLYALQISNVPPGVQILGNGLLFSNHGIVGPSAASPMCSPDHGIFTDFGAQLPGPTSQPNSAGVLAATDCTNPVWGNSPPSYCVQAGNNDWPFQLRYILPLDNAVSGCDPTPPEPVHGLPQFQLRLGPVQRLLLDLSARQAVHQCRVLHNEWAGARGPIARLWERLRHH